VAQLEHVSLASQTPFEHALMSRRHEASQRGVPAHPPHVAPPRFAPSHCSPASRTPLPQLMLIVTWADVASWPTCVIVSPADGSLNDSPFARKRTSSVLPPGLVWMLVRSAYDARMFASKPTGRRYER
jgi:hypothetical protein